VCASTMLPDQLAIEVAIVIPAYNEIGTIADVVSAVASYGTPIVVDDCSNDGTGERAAAEGAIVVRHHTNGGYDAAIESGLARAAELGAKFAVTFDADGQHDARVLNDFLFPLRSGNASFVLGIRPRSARFAEFLFNFYTQVRFGVGDILCGLKAYNITLYREHGGFGRYPSIGTALALSALRRGLHPRLVSVPIHPRIDQPRFGSRIRANIRILFALAVAIHDDLIGATDRTSSIPRAPS
jgi:glycosyltransferase involved in cell wall biosynthesis